MTLNETNPVHHKTERSAATPKVYSGVATLTLVRHGQSEWNKKNLFTGWTDVDMTDEGRAEVHATAKLLADIPFDIAYTSDLKRARETLDIILHALKREPVPIVIAPELRERNYGAWNGKNKEEVRAEYGDEQYWAVRRGWSARPPEGESLEDTAARVIPFLKGPIMSDMRSGRSAIVSAHGNSLRTIVKELEGISDTDIANLEIPIGKARIYTFDENGVMTGKQILEAPMIQS
jgi:2,3-bisphosphoglycerate-dependent phosphoglycerate mutase